ncbi:unnamed protein product [Porites evermanni]|uniref:Uncharacterized protein n=1 Tax=Porites evermanni TaxID=104178 RepID=A0ABN8PWV6_9CNID|nr:unnamed protein product [Porites evermanni]
MKDYKDYMHLVCPYSCGLCNDILGDLSASGEATSGTGYQGESQDNAHRVIPEVGEDFEGITEKEKSSKHIGERTDHKDENESLSGSGEEQDGPIFRGTATKKAESRFHGEVEQQGESGDQQPISGSGINPTGANFWAVVRIEPESVNGGSKREHQLNRRSDTFIPQEATEGSASGMDTSGEIPSRKNQIPVESFSGQDVTSGENNVNQRDQVATTSSSKENAVSGEDDAPFESSSTESELDSGCSSGEGCFESDGVQEEQGGQSNSRSVIAKLEVDAIASGSASNSGDSSDDVSLHPHFDVLAGPYDDKTPTSGGAPLSSGSGSELGNVLHNIEDAIFEKGEPLEISRDASSGSGLSSVAHTDNQNDFATSGSGSGTVDKEENQEVFVTPQNHTEKISLMEKMMKVGKLQAFGISHVANVGGTSRNKVPSLESAVQSDLGKGEKVSIILNQDFHDGYANENSAAYEILANSVKKEVEKVLGSNAVVSEISFSEIREPRQSPSFSKVMTTFKLLGDTKKLEKAVKKGTINSLVVDKKFFHAS